MSSMDPHPELVDGIDIDAVAAAVRSCPGVDDLDAGTIASVASYLPGRRVIGVRIGEDTVTVQVRTRWGAPVTEVAREIRNALIELVGRRRVDIVVSDVTDAPGEQQPASMTSSGGIEVNAWTSRNSIADSGATSSGTTIPTGAVTPPTS